MAASTLHEYGLVSAVIDCLDESGRNGVFQESYWIYCYIMTIIMIDSVRDVSSAGTP